MGLDLGSIVSAAVGGPTGGILGAAANPILQHNQNIRDRKFIESQTQKQMDFQEEMSNTQLQRGVADAEKAGLHPWTIAGSGGASSPSGASGGTTMQAPSISMPDMFSYGMSLANLELAQKKLGIEGEKAAADISKKLSEEDLNKMKKFILEKQGPKAELGMRAHELLKKVIDFMIQDFKKPSHNYNNQVPGFDGFQSNPAIPMPTN